jgi:RecB family exonuclease
LSSAIPGLDERGACGADGAGGADAANTVVLDEQTGAAILVRRYEESAVRRAMRAQGEALAGAEDGEGECEGESADISEFAPLVRPVWSVAAAGTAAAAEAAAAAGGATAACAPCQFSVSALMCFSHCPRWYLYEYVCRLGRIPRDTARAFGSELQLNAAVRGQIVHSACERCGRETDLAQARALVLEELRFRGVRRGRAEAVADELMPMIDTFLLRYPGLAREGDKEVGFLMDLGGPVVSGVMDRVDVQADGSVLVVDLKTNRVRGQAVDEAMARYGVQLDAYAVAAGRVHGTDCVTARLHFLYPDEVRERSYGPDELREAAEKLKELAVRAARHDLRNTPIQRIAECDRCYFAPLCGIVRGHLKAPLDARELHEVREASFDEEVLPVISLSDDEYLDLGGVGEVDYD